MSEETLETLDDRIHRKIDDIKGIANIYQTYILEPEDQIEIDTIQENIEEFYGEYEIGVSAIFLMPQETKKDEYINFLDRNNILQKLQGVYEKLEKASQTITSKISLETLDKQLIKNHSLAYITNIIAIRAVKIHYDVCEDCGNQMIHDSSTSEIKCVNNGCGLIKSLIGVSFECPKAQTNDAHIKKKKKYKHLCYSETQLKILQCNVKKVPPQKLVNKFLETLRKNNITNEENITIYVVRSFLKQLGAVEYYKYAAYFRQKAIGFEILRLSNEEHSLIMNFQKVCIIKYNLYDKLSKNCAHHLYILYKVMELPDIIRNDKKRKQLLSQVYMQSQKTLEKRDEIWRKICDELKITFRPTDRHLYQNYF
jgi:hypothetical protein